MNHFFCFRNLEKSLMASSRELNVFLSPMEHPMNRPIERHWRLNDIGREVTNFFMKAKADKMELVVVVIPDYPAGVYGKETNISYYFRP